MKPPKEKVCLECSTKYQPRTMGQKVCSIPCAIARTKRLNQERLEKEERKANRERKEKIKTRQDYAKEAQAAFNRYIRLRDMHKPCVSCGQSPYKGQRHASHYRTRAAAPQLSYNVFNVAASCSQCNNHKSGNVVEYRIELVRRIGEERVQALENSYRMASHNIEYLKRIKAVFNRKAKLYDRLRHREMS